MHLETMFSKLSQHQPQMETVFYYVKKWYNISSKEVLPFLPRVKL